MQRGKKKRKKRKTGGDACKAHSRISEDVGAMEERTTMLLANETLLERERGKKKDYFLAVKTKKKIKMA